MRKHDRVTLLINIKSKKIIWIFKFNKGNLQNFQSFFEASEREAVTPGFRLLRFPQYCLHICKICKRAIVLYLQWGPRHSPNSCGAPGGGWRGGGVDGWPSYAEKRVVQLFRCSQLNPDRGFIPSGCTFFWEYGFPES